MYSLHKILAASALSFVLLPSIAFAGKCEGFWECSWGIAKSTGKLATKTFTRTGTIIISGVTGAAEAIADDKGVVGVVGGALGSAGSKVAESVGDTLDDVSDLGRAVHDAAKD